VTYIGASKPFAYGDFFSVRVNLLAGPQPVSGKLNLSCQFVTVVNGALPFTVISVVDFANSGTSAVAHDQTLIGDGTSTTPLGLAPGGVTAADLATGAVSAAKISSGQVVKGLNGLTDNVSLAAGPNVTITPSGNTLTIASTGGGGNAILNQTTQQAAANFNISGNGTAGGTLSGNAVNSTTQFTIGGAGVLSASGGTINVNGSPLVNSNTFAGVGAGSSVTPNPPTFAGELNTFFGVNAGTNTASGCCNSFFGNLVGLKNTTGRSNTFFGGSAGIGNTTGSFNAFFGDGAGSDSFNPGVVRTGNLNTSIGYLSGGGVPTGSSNTFLGSNTIAASDVSNATAIGANALVAQATRSCWAQLTGLTARRQTQRLASARRLRPRGSPWPV
jgi:hypothetical protein